MKRILPLLLIILSSCQAFASHIKGGEITWKCLGASGGVNAGKYVFQLKLYRDCTGIQLAPVASQPISVYGHPTLNTITCTFV